MCGILGIVSLGGSDLPDRARVHDALQTMAHRGPDGQGIVFPDERVALGHLRLAIIDLTDDSAQPMMRSERYWLTYNGEIFNYLELRAELEALGTRFTTNGDTEVLLAAFETWGRECVSRFNGMWAFAIYDTVERTLFCSRDRFGIKPFNYAVTGEHFLFASEIKAILACDPQLAEPDYGMISSFCRTSAGAQHEQTWFRRIKRLQPGHNLLLDADGTVTVERYWNYPSKVETIGAQVARDRYAELFRDAVRLRMRSDVPLGITLSAGVDSNSIAYVMQSEVPAPHHSYTARFVSEDFTTSASHYRDATLKIDEAVVARRVAEALGMEAHVVDTRYGDLAEGLARIVWHLESGNSSPAVVPLMQLMAEATKTLTVVMEGQGADELLAGYVGNVIVDRVAAQIRRGELAAAVRSVREYARTYTLSGAVLLALRLASNRHPWIARARQKITGLDRIYGPRLTGHAPVPDYPPLADFPGETAMARSLREQHSGGLVNLLHYGDAISMAHSIESRLPFLDHRLVEFVWQLPDGLKLDKGVGKVIHRQAMRGCVDDAILDERVKFGFSTPISNEFRGDSEQARKCLAILTSERCLARGLFDRDGLVAIIEAHRAGKADHGPLLFRLLSVELWFRLFMDREGVAPNAIAPEPAIACR